MDLEGIMPGEISQMKTNTVLFHLRVECKNKQTDKQTKQNRNRHIHTQNKIFVTRKEGFGGWVK